MAQKTSSSPEQDSAFIEKTKKWLESYGDRFPVSSLQNPGVGFYDALICRSLVVDVAEYGRVVCTLRVPARLCNSGQRLHGGAITSFVDIVGTAAMFATGATYTGVSVEINVTFTAAAPVDEEVEIEAKILRMGRTLAVVTVDLRMKATGELVAQGRHTKFIGGAQSKL